MTTPLFITPFPENKDLSLIMNCKLNHDAILVILVSSLV